MAIRANQSQDAEFFDSQKIKHKEACEPEDQENLHERLTTGFAMLDEACLEMDADTVLDPHLYCTKPKKYVL